MMNRYRLMMLSFTLIFIPSILIVSSRFYFNISSDLSPGISSPPLILPIYIDDQNPDYNWESYAQTHPWCRGSGSSTDPYIISSVMISSQDSDGITIRNSNVYFLIGGCVIKYCGGSGISFHNVVRGGIIGCEIFANNDCGIDIYDSSRCFMYNNHIRENAHQGISLFKCVNTDLVENTVENNQLIGIDIFTCENTKVESNTITTNNLFGVAVALNSHVEFNKNTISNHNDALYTYKSSNVTVSFNILKESSEFGVLVQYDCTDCTIFNNTLLDNRFCIGISECCENISVYNNTSCQVIAIDSDFGSPPFTEDELESLQGHNYPLSIPGYTLVFLFLSVFILLFLFIERIKLKRG